MSRDNHSTTVLHKANRLREMIKAPVDYVTGSDTHRTNYRTYVLYCRSKHDNDDNDRQKPRRPVAVSSGGASRDSSAHKNDDPILAGLPFVFLSVQALIRTRVGSFPGP